MFKKKNEKVQLKNKEKYQGFRTLDIISNKTWYSLFSRLLGYQIYADKDYFDAVGVTYTFNPVTDHIMTNCSSKLFNMKKAAAMYNWYKNADATDDSIIKYFDEYKHCIDDKHNKFNSNYGIYAYKQKGLSKCINILKKDPNSRQACFCINNNTAMGKTSIDKLCTNTIQFIIRNKQLRMVVQMRSSNFLTLLPYDAFMFSVFYWEVYHKLKKAYEQDLNTGNIIMQVASLHCYRETLDMLIANEEAESLDFNDTLLRFDTYNKHEVEQFLKEQL